MAKRRMKPREMIVRACVGSCWLALVVYEFYVTNFVGLLVAIFLGPWIMWAIFKRLGYDIPTVSRGDVLALVMPTRPKRRKSK